jgi:hypothetical protein
MNIYKKKSIRSSRPQTTVNKKTLDIHHNSFMEDIRQKNETSKSLKQELDSINEEIANLEGFSELDNTQAESLVGLKDRRSEIKEKLSMISHVDETQYLTNTASILFKYYDLLENNKPIELSSAPHKSHSILKYFSEPTVAASSSNTASPKPEESESNRGSLLDKYMQYVDHNYIKTTCSEDECPMCQFCGSQSVTIMNNDGYILCNECHSVEYILVDHDKPSYKDPPKEISYFAYKRINHFRLMNLILAMIETFLIFNQKLITQTAILCC